jgi:hypothetical protein
LKKVEIRLPRLPLGSSEPSVSAFLAHWARVGGAAELPVWDAVDAMRAIPKLIPWMVMLEVRTPPELRLRVAGSAMGDFVGMELTGRDLLELTSPELRALRHGHMAAIVGTPCGAQATFKVRGRSGLVASGEMLILPARNRGSGEVVALMLVAFNAEREVGADTDPVFPMADKVAYIDLGFGLPPRDDKPNVVWSGD